MSWPGQQRPRPVRWVAEPPRTAGGPARPREERPYTGPPSYPAIPRWGFPHVAWRWPTTVPGTPSERPRPAERLQMIARNAVGVLCTVAALAVLAGGAESWRYALLVRSRDAALSADIVGASDALVLIISLLTFLLGLTAIAITVWWLLVARGAAEEQSGRPPARSMWRTLLAVVVPGVNLVMAGSVLAELEHAASEESPLRRPRPSRLVWCWWAAWVVNGVLLAVTIGWRVGDSVQAQADAVLLNAALNLSAAVLAAITAFVVHRLTRLLAPARTLAPHRMRVLDVRGAPEPPRRERPTTAAR